MHVGSIEHFLTAFVQGNVIAKVLQVQAGNKDKALGPPRGPVAEGPLLQFVRVRLGLTNTGHAPQRETSDRSGRRRCSEP